jgi:hypothetical protein
MMGTTAVVQSFERVSDENGNGVDVKIETAGADNVDEAEHFANCGDDAPPLPGDFAAISDAPGKGSLRVGGYADAKNLGKALGGEKRIYARSSDGTLVAEIWLKGDGSIHVEAIQSGSDVTISTLQSGGKINLNGVQIDTSGNVTVPGKVNATGEVTTSAAGAPVKLSTHIHPTGTGPSGPPQPGS